MNKKLILNMLQSKKNKKPTSYSDFTLNDLDQLFDIKNRQIALQLIVKDFSIPSWLLKILEIHKTLPKGTEKAKSEMLITPLLSALYDANNTKMKYFSGYSFDVAPEKSLKGRCDYLFSKSESSEIQAPIFGIFEAKDDSIEHYYGQCGAEMYAALLFNQQNNSDIQIIHGAVSDGVAWKFLKLENSFLQIDTKYYTIEDLASLLGVLQGIIDFYE
jgi:hypothetical protein